MRTRFLALVIALVGLSGMAGAVAVSGIPEGTSAQTRALGGRACVPISTPTALPVGLGLGLGGGCSGVRPGAPLQTPIGGCTFNFMWSGSDGSTYMGTAGHCALGGPGDAEEVWAAGEGGAVADGQGNRIGELAYAVLDGERDFALIRLAPGVEASPQMCHFGGPTGVNSDLASLVPPTLLQQYGQGVGIGELLPARTHVALGMPDPNHVFATGVVLPGDSGSGVTTPDGRAVGVVVAVGVLAESAGVGGIDAGTIAITRLAPQLAGATEATGVSYTLETAPTL